MCCSQEAGCKAVLSIWELPSLNRRKSNRKKKQNQKKIWFSLHLPQNTARHLERCTLILKSQKYHVFLKSVFSLMVRFVLPVPQEVRNLLFPCFGFFFLSLFQWDRHTGNVASWLVFLKSQIISCAKVPYLGKKQFPRRVVCTAKAVNKKEQQKSFVPEQRLRGF